jgi:hypothetical protein
LKLFQEWGKREIKENGGGGEYKYNIFDTLLQELCKCYNVPHSAQK